MHPTSASLIAYCDAETAAGRSRRIARHLAKCQECQDQMRRIGTEKEALLAGAPVPAFDSRPGLDAVLFAIAAWQEHPDGEAASELKTRLQWQLEKYFGLPASRLLERPGIRAEELLGKANEMIEVFLGPEAGEAVQDDCLRGLVWPRPAREVSQ
jgi:hypothetical protein